VEELPPEDIEGIDDYVRQMSEIDLLPTASGMPIPRRAILAAEESDSHNLRHFGDLMERLANYLSGLEAAMCD